jgi:glycosyltransferase involved in cell wall biosynthesis
MGLSRASNSFVDGCKVQRGHTNVLHLITELDTGGAQKALARLLARLDRSRFEPSVACLYNGDGAVAREIRGLGIPVVDLGMRAKWRWDALWRLYRRLCKERPTILHTWMFHANLPGRLLGRLAGVPIIVCGERTMGQESRRRHWANRMTHPLADRIMCVSPAVADFVVKEVGIPKDKTVVIPNGVERRDSGSLPTQREARAWLGLPTNRPLIGTVTRLAPVKGLDVLLEAMLSLPDVHAVFVGKGPEKGRLEAMAKELGIGERSQFVGRKEDVSTWLAALDAFVLPSHWEGMSNALLEAMAAGLPVVATAVGGTPDVVLDGVTGLLVSPGDPASLARAIGRMIRDPNLRQKMGRAGRARIEQHFSIEETVRRTEEMYTVLLEEKGL